MRWEDSVEGRRQDEQFKRWDFIKKTGICWVIIYLTPAQINNLHLFRADRYRKERFELLSDLTEVTPEWLMEHEIVTIIQECRTRAEMRVEIVEYIK